MASVKPRKSENFIFEENCIGCHKNFESINRVPKLMNCGHIFCDDCIKSCKRKCITCGKVSSTVKEFPIDKFSSQVPSYFKSSILELKSSAISKSIENYPLESACTVCNKNFESINNPPKLMNCGHTFCEQCIFKKSKRKCFQCGVTSSVDWEYPIDKLTMKMNSSYMMRICETYSSSNLQSLTKNFTLGMTFAAMKLGNDEKCLFTNIREKAEELIDYETIIRKINTIAIAKSNESVENSLLRAQDGILDVLKDVKKIEENLQSSVFQLPKVTHEKPDLNYDFWKNIDRNLSALKRKNAYVGHEIKKVMSWGKLTTIHNTLLFGALRFTKHPPVEATLLQFHWMKPFLTDMCRTVYLEMEPSDQDLKKIRTTSPDFPKSFKVYIVLRSNFMNDPICKQFSYLITGEKGISYINAKVKVSNDFVRIDDQRKRDLLENIPDVEPSKTWNAEVGSVMASRIYGEYTCFYLSLSKQKLRGDYVNIGYVYSGLHFFQIHNKFMVKDCGFVVFENEKMKRITTKK